ncbi:hypothetical protein QN277_010833 [Acacia crassicarpa]|uniref:Uncharacterized protein n=1 Tax=Acacia crassicarpa TaxID=499986 RepID=A0AAE1IPL3_9FABA|nr:hypothetical protein QN277_010833 [Acacia crassicarpa]
MDSFSTRNHRKQYDGKRPSSRQILSFSSSPSPSSASASASSSSSVDHSTCSHDDYSLLGPATPLRLISRIPFSWEHFPGIPKNLNNHNNIAPSPSHKLLPLPPPTTSHLEHHPIRSTPRKKNLIQGSFQRDPFFAALVECSKSNNNDYDHHHEEASAAATTTSNNGLWNNNAAKVSRSLSDRFESVSLFASCKRTCAVSESLVHLPSSRRTSPS